MKKDNITITMNRKFAIFLCIAATVYFSLELALMLMKGMP